MIINVILSKQNKNIKNYSKSIKNIIFHKIINPYINPQKSTTINKQIQISKKSKKTLNYLMPILNNKYLIKYKNI